MTKRKPTKAESEAEAKRLCEDVAGRACVKARVLPEDWGTWETYVFAESSRVSYRALARESLATKAVLERCWRVANNRRLYLIQDERALTTAQRAELASLQTLADDAVRILAPLPIPELDAMLKTIRSRKGARK